MPWPRREPVLLKLKDFIRFLKILSTSERACLYIICLSHEYHMVVTCTSYTVPGMRIQMRGHLLRI